MNEQLFKGCATALATPFRAGEVDFGALKSLIARQIESGVDALVLCGTTGEPASLSDGERRSILSLGVAMADGHIPVIAGCGSNDTCRAAALAQEAEALGADGVLLVTPYYNRASQAGLVQHFARVAQATALPVILYNVPSRTGVNLLPETARTLCRVPNILGVKEAGGDVSQAARLLEACPDAAVYCGCDDQTLPLMALGAQGVISVASNVVPGPMTALTHALLAGDLPAARTLHRQLLPLMHALFTQVSPIPLKAALAALGLCENELRLPLTPLEDDSALREALRGLPF